MAEKNVLREEIDELKTELKSMNQNIRALTSLLAELLDSLDAETLLENPPNVPTPEGPENSGVGLYN